MLEVGSGTGQHAVWFRQNGPGWQWQCSDVEENLDGIQQWIDYSGVDLPAPVEFDVSCDPFPDGRFDTVFTANSLHIMPWAAALGLFRLLKSRTGVQRFIAYGPFNRDGEYTSPSNAEFDASLRANAAHQGIRNDVEVIAQLAQSGFMLDHDQAMPANNRLLIFSRKD